MKSIIKESLFGILVVMTVTICEFIVTLPFGEGQELTPERYAFVLNREFLLTALPAFFVTFFLAKFRKVKDLSDALRKSIIWTAVLLIYYFVIGIGNDNLLPIFQSLGLYILFTCTFLGPIVYSKTKKNVA